MKQSFQLILVLCICGCYTGVRDIEFDGSPFDNAFEGNIIEVVTIDSQTSGMGCKIEKIHFKFLPEVLIRIKEMSSVKQEYFNVYFRCNQEINSAIYDPDGQIIEFPNTAIYNPGISSFSDIHMDVVYSISGNFDTLVDDGLLLEVVFLIRDRPNANEFHREEIVKQSELITCP